MNLFVRIVFLFTQRCVGVADAFGLVPVLSGDRFMRLRPGDALLAHVFYSVYFMCTLAALVWLSLAEGMFATLFIFLGFAPLVYLLVSVLLRVTLEVLLLFNKDKTA